MNAEPAVELACTAGKLTVRWDREALGALADGGDLEGELWQLEGPSVEAAKLLRIVSGGLEDGSVLGLLAVREPAADAHGDELVAAAIARPGGMPETFEEARLSTEYDAEGHVRRAGFELWAEDDTPPTRGAADSEAFAAVQRGPLAGEAARLRLRLDGVAGFALYELLRPG